jgi:hypothetical protein
MLAWHLLTTRGLLAVGSCAACAALVPTADREVHSFTHAHSGPVPTVSAGAEEPAQRPNRSAWPLLLALLVGAAIALGVWILLVSR